MCRSTFIVVAYVLKLRYDKLIRYYKCLAILHRCLYPVYRLNVVALIPEFTSFFYMLVNALRDVEEDILFPQIIFVL